MGGWNAGCAERRLSGVGGAGRKPTAERQQGAVLRPHPLMGRKNSRSGGARSLSDWPSAVFSLLPPFAAPPLRGGWCQGWGAAPPGGLGLDAREPPRSTLRTIQGGRKARRGLGAGRATPRTVVDGVPCWGKPRAARRAAPGTGRSGTAAYLQEWSDPQSPWRGCGGDRNQPHGQSAAAPVPSFLSPWGGDEVKQGAASVRARCRADRGPDHRLAAQRKAGAVQPRSVFLSAAALTGPPTAAQTGVPL